jgi:hypothetical protein
MRSTSFVAVLLLSACGSSGSSPGDDDGGDDDGGGQVDAGDGPADSFRLVTTDVEIAAGDERTHCYHATLPIDRAVGVKRWSSVMTPGSHHMIVYALASSDHPDGTIDEDCSVLGSLGAGLPTWSYSAQTPTADFPMPDGVGVTMAASQKVVIEMHYLNASVEPIQAHVELTGEYYAEDVDFTPASAFVTYDTSIDIPAQSIGQAGSIAASTSTAATSRWSRDRAPPPTRCAWRWGTSSPRPSRASVSTERQLTSGRRCGLGPAPRLASARLTAESTAPRCSGPSGSPTTGSAPTEPGPLPGLNV